MPISTKSGKPDGIFGKETDATVRDFQGKNGLTPDGVVGRKTMGRLDELGGGGKASGEPEIANDEASLGKHVASEMERVNEGESYGPDKGVWYDSNYFTEHQKDPAHLPVGRRVAQRPRAARVLRPHRLDGLDAQARQERVRRDPGVAQGADDRRVPHARSSRSRSRRCARRSATPSSTAATGRRAGPAQVRPLRDPAGQRRDAARGRAQGRRRRPARTASATSRSATGSTSSTTRCT